MTGLVVSSFNADTFVRYLENQSDPPDLRVTVAPFGQVVPSLLDPELYQPRPDFVVVWTEPQDVLPSLRQALEHELVSVEAVLADVDTFAEQLRLAKERTGDLFVPAWLLPELRRDFGFFERTAKGPAYLLDRANVRLAETAHDLGIHVLDARAWIEGVSGPARSPQLRYMAKTPFTQAVFEEAALDLRAALLGLRGKARKLLLVDLDDTIWGGTVGDVGWENLRLGGHDPKGEAFVDFQRSLRALCRRGILLGVVSKNDETVATEAFERHPEMVLRLKDLAGWEIGWSDKAEGVLALTSRLNLGLEAVVFIDDNPAERDRVKEALPDVLVPDWPSSPMLYREALLSLRCFASPGVTAEDRARGESYVRERAHSTVVVGDLDDWLDGLHLKVQVNPLANETLARAGQLLNKTNQMNLSTRRMSEADLRQWAGESNHGVWTFSVSDRLGDSGLTGLLSLELQGKEARLVDFVLSCRVMGRRVEETLLFAAIELSRSGASSSLEVDFKRTERNAPCLRFLQSAGLLPAGDNAFRWLLAEDYPSPRGVTLLGLEASCAAFATRSGSVTTGA